MKCIVFLSLALVALTSARPDEASYDPRFDNFNVDELVDNVRLLKAYAHCFIGDGNCTPDGKSFKKWIPDAVKTDCAKCSPKQKVMAAKVIKALRANLPAEWDMLVTIHDPDKINTSHLDAFLKEYAP